MSKWRTELEAVQYTPPGSGPVIDLYEAKKIALLAYADGAQWAVTNLLEIIREGKNPSEYIPILEQHLTKQLELTYGTGTATNNPPPGEEGRSTDSQEQP